MSVQKKEKAKIKLTIPAKKATPAPPVGSMLGQQKVNIMEFCKAFNDRTKSMEDNCPVPVLINVYVDNSFDFVCKTPPTSYLLKQKAKIDKGSSSTKKDGYKGSITINDCIEIAKIKAPDLNSYCESQAVKMIRGSAESMGIEVKNDN